MEKKTDFKSLSTKAKIGYVWDYYRWPILIAAFIIAIAASLIHHFVTYQEPALNVIMFNNDSSPNTTTEGFDEFLRTNGHETDEDSVVLAADFAFPENGQGNDYNDYMAMSTIVLAGGQDLLFGTGDVFLNYAKQGIFVDLSAILPAELLEKYKDQLIYSTNNGETASYPCAVELTNNEWLKKYNYYDTCYFGILECADHPELAAEFATFLLSYDEYFFFPTNEKRIKNSCESSGIAASSRSFTHSTALSLHVPNSSTRYGTSVTSSCSPTPTATAAIISPFSR